MLYLVSIISRKEKRKKKKVQLGSELVRTRRGRGFSGAEPD